MKKVDMLKQIGGVIISVGVSAIIGNAIKATTPHSVKTIQKICIGIGAFVLSGMVADKAVTYAGSQIDEVIKQIKDIVTNEEI